MGLLSEGIEATTARFTSDLLPLDFQMGRINLYTRKICKGYILKWQIQGFANTLEQRKIACPNSSLPVQVELISHAAYRPGILPFDLDETSIGQFIEHDMSFIPFIGGAIFFVVDQLLITKRFKNSFRFLKIFHNEFDFFPAENPLFVFACTLVGEPRRRILPQAQDPPLGAENLSSGRSKRRFVSSTRSWIRWAPSSSRRVLSLLKS